MFKEKVIITGAGLAGSLLSLFLAKRGIETEVYESREDLRQAEISAGRSINLALSDRGIRALKAVGMDEYMLEKAVPMYGRLIHSVDGEKNFLPYSGRAGEYINSVSRGGLNIALINEADKYAESKFFFNQKCVDFDCATGEAIFENGKKIKGGTLIAADGAGSAIRRAMMNNRCVERFNFSQKFLEHGYKELSIPPKSEFVGTLPHLSENAEGEFLLKKNALHIWARHQFMMIALPNFDGSFTCTLFLAFEGENSFANLQDEAALIKFFEENFPDALPLMPDLTEEFFANPTGNLGTIKCFPWNVGGKALLLGDSAHALVPFYGQGMNAAFEDCRVLDEIIEKHGTNWEKVFEEYGKQRKINTDAIADLAIENFYEMRDAVADPIFVRKRDLETRLEQNFPDYFSKYSLVTFREDIPYSEAKRRGNAQNELLMKICSDFEDINELDLSEVMNLVSQL